MKTKLFKVFFIYFIFNLTSCSYFQMVEYDVGQIDSKTLEEIKNIQVYNIDTRKPDIENYLGNVIGYSCRRTPDDKPENIEDALLQLKIDAHNLGANGIIEVAFEWVGTDPYIPNCYGTITARGIAIKYKK